MSADNLSAEKRTAVEWIEENRDSLVDLSDEVFGFAEPGFREYKSSRAHARFLSEHGFDVELGVADMPTAYVATYGDGEPIIGLMAEYDATPGDSQRPVPHKDPVEEHAAGYGDAHNALGAGSIGAAIGLKAAMDANELKGTINLFGTPAEKIVAGKPYLAKEGYFDDLDAVVAWHPHAVNTTAWDAGPSPYRGVYVTFEGETFTAAKPWNGTDALDAATLMRVMVNFMKEHMPNESPEENAVIGSIIPNGGQHPTNMAETAEIYFGCRGTLLSTMDEMETMLRRCARAAADVTGCQYEFREVVSTRYWLPNYEMARVAYENLEAIGPPEYSEEARSFANDVLEEVGREPVEQPFDDTLREPERDVTAEFYPGIADDVSEFSWAAPTARIYLSYYIQGRHNVGESNDGGTWYEQRLKNGGYVEEEDGMPVWTTAALAKTEVAHQCLTTAAKIIAGTAIDLLTDDEALTRANEEYEDRIDEEYVPLLLDEDAEPPTDITFPPYYPEGWEIPTDIGSGPEP